MTPKPESYNDKFRVRAAKEERKKRVHELTRAVSDTFAYMPWVPHRARAALNELAAMAKGEK